MCFKYFFILVRSDVQHCCDNSGYNRGHSSIDSDPKEKIFILTVFRMMLAVALLHIIFLSI